MLHGIRNPLDRPQVTDQRRPSRHRRDSIPLERRTTRNYWDRLVRGRDVEQGAAWTGRAVAAAVATWLEGGTSVSPRERSSSLQPSSPANARSLETATAPGRCTRTDIFTYQRHQRSSSFTRKPNHDSLRPGRRPMTR